MGISIGSSERWEISTGWTCVASARGTILPIFLRQGAVILVGKILGHYEILEQPATPRIHVVLNWFEELKERVPTGR